MISPLKNLSGSASKLRALVCLVFLYGFLTPIFAATSARIQLPDGDLYIGERFTFYIIIDGEKSIPQPNFPEDSDLNIRFVGAAASENDGAPRYAITYEAVPLRAGQLFIPGFELNAGGSYLEIEPTSLRVQVPATTDKMTLEVALSQEACYVGEPIILSFTWRSQLSLNGISALDLRVPALVDGRIKVYDTVDSPAPNDKAAIGLPVENQRIISHYAETKGNKRPTALVTFQKILVPTTSGTFTLEPSTLLCSFAKPKDSRFKGARYPSYFNNDFFDTDSSGNHQRLLISAPSIRLHVKDLPTAGRPENFDGIIGSFTLSAAAEPAVATTADPITLTLEATEYPFPQIFELPSLTTLGALPHSFQIPEDRAPGKLSEGKKTFRQTIRALRPKIPEIPAIAVSYFDPTTGKYGQTKTSPIPVTITQAEQVSAFDAQFSDGTALRNIVTPKPGGIHHNRMNDELLQSKTPPTSALRAPWFWIALLAIPPLALAAFALWNRENQRRIADPAAARARTAHRNFQRALNSGQDEDQAARDYLCDRLHLTRGATDSRELKEQLATHKVDEPELTDYLLRQDHLPYTTTSNGNTPSRPDIPTIIAKLERSFKK